LGDHVDGRGLPVLAAGGILAAEPWVRISRAAEAGEGRADELLTYFVSQVVGRLDAVRPAAEVVAEMVRDCEAILGSR
jgi:hypothetical protein